MIPHTRNHTRAALRTISARDTLGFVLPVALACLAFAFASAYLAGLGH